MNYRLCVPCLLGLEALIADELKRMGAENVASENGRVYFSGDESLIARANINLRVGERILLELGKFDAFTFDELFEKTKRSRGNQSSRATPLFPSRGTVSTQNFFPSVIVRK